MHHRHTHNNLSGSSFVERQGLRARRRMERERRVKSTNGGRKVEGSGSRVYARKKGEGTWQREWSQGITSKIVMAGDVNGVMGM